MVEPRFIYAHDEWVYMGRPKIIYRWQRLYIVGGKILYGGERFYYSLGIVLRFQLIVKGRAKILPGVEFSYSIICLLIHACVRSRLYIAERLYIAG
jgi:hypothetical protein